MLFSISPSEHNRLVDATDHWSRSENKHQAEINTASSVMYRITVFMFAVLHKVYIILIT